MSIIILYILSTDMQISLGQAVAWVFSVLSLIFGFLAVRLVKGYDNEIKNLKAEVEYLKKENSEIKLAAERRLTFYVRENARISNKLTELKTLILNRHSYENEKE